MWWIALYMVIGALLGEVYARGTPTAGETPKLRYLTYVLGSLMWPVIVFITIRSMLSAEGRREFSEEIAKRQKQLRENKEKQKGTKK